ncbi:MAG: aminotransferase class IV [Candidatus Zixiibacteriota bacterium]
MARTLKVVTSINGRLVPYGRDKISVFDNALLYAEGLFETFLAIDDRIIFMEEHLERLYNGARIIGLDIPAPPSSLAAWMRKTVRAHPDRITKLRLTITSGESARYVGQQGKPQVILSASPHQMPSQPFKLWVSDFRVDQQSVFRQIKTLSYAIHAAALRQAHRERCDDALLLNERNHVAEVTSANVYWVMRGRLYTPPLSAGCLEGVTRKRVFKEAAVLGLKISEKNTTLPALVEADEVLISSSLKLVVGVARVKTPARTYVTRTGPVTKLITRHFRQLVGLER